MATTASEWRDRAAAWAAAGGLRLLAGGRLYAPDGAGYPVTNPADGSVLGHAPDAGDADVDAAVGAAAEAAETWARTDAEDRAAVVRAMADAVDAAADEIAALDSLDTGVPFWMMRADVDTGVRRMRMFADWALRLTGETVPATGTHLTYTQRVPHGVVARIVAYNHPAMFAVSKVAAPLVAGNAVVLKPSDRTPLSALRLAELWADVVPAGLLGVLTGSGPDAGARLVRDPRVRRVAFTGSEATGRAIQRTAAETSVKHVSLELGGKNALLVLPDADLDAVTEGAVRGMNLAFAGQSCGSTSRVLVPRHLLDDLLGRLVTAFAAVPVGDPFEPGVRMGPLIGHAHRERVAGFVADAVSSTATLVTGGGPPERPAKGSYYAPTILLETDPASTLATEEVFGPVLTVIGYDDVGDAVRLANGVRYGLTASVYGRDVGAALRTADRLAAGYVWVNDTSTHFAALAFGGVKDSGVGREESFEELLDYTHLRATSVRLD